MNEFFLKHFVKNYKDTKNPKVRESYGKLAGIMGVISNSLLCILKVVIGIFSSSISIIADGINNLADASSSVITLVGFKLASLPEDEEHPYGHARIEYIAGLIVSMFIIFVGISLGKSSVEKIISPEALQFSYITIVILIIAILLKIWQACFNYNLGKRIDSPTLIATATDSRNDVIATSIVLFSVVLTYFTGINLDGYLGLMVAIFIICSGISLIKETSSPLLGEAPDEELIKQISEMVLSYEHVLGIHDLVVHNYGPGKVFASIHIEVDADMDIMVSHDIIDNIEKDLGKALHIHFVAHLDPIKTDDPVIKEVRMPILRCLAKFDGLRNIHDLRCVPGKTHTNIIFDVIMESTCTATKKEIIREVDTVLKNINPNYFVVITFDKAYTNL